MKQYAVFSATNVSTTQAWDQEVPMAPIDGTSLRGIDTYKLFVYQGDEALFREFAKSAKAVRDSDKIPGFLWEAHQATRGAGTVMIPFPSVRGVGVWVLSVSPEGDMAIRAVEGHVIEVLEGVVTVRHNQNWATHALRYIESQPDHTGLMYQNCLHVGFSPTLTKVKHKVRSRRTSIVQRAMRVLQHGGV